MANDRLNILLPVGRLVQGSVSVGQTTDGQNQPLVYKSGPNAGQPRTNYFFAVAIPKTPGVTHWCYETSTLPQIGDWGMKLYQFGSQQWPQGQFQSANNFSWKIADGDSTELDQNGKRNCDKVGFAGHWIIRFSGALPPRTVNKDGSQQVPPESIETGFYVQCYANVASNNNTQKPGLYVNHDIVSLQGYGERISSGPAPSAVGFGGAQLPQGASATPIGGMTTLPPAGPALPGAPALPGGAPTLPGVPTPAMPPAVAPVLPGAAPTLPGTPAGVPPLPGAALPGAPALPGGAPAPELPPVSPAPAAVPAPLPGNVPPAPGGFTATVLGQPPVPAAPQMTAAAGGHPYETYIAQGWTDALLVQHGMMLPR